MYYRHVLMVLDHVPFKLPYKYGSVCTCLELCTLLKLYITIYIGRVFIELDFLACFKLEVLMFTLVNVACWCYGSVKVVYY